MYIRMGRDCRDQLFVPIRETDGRVADGKGHDCGAKLHKQKAELWEMVALKKNFYSHPLCPICPIEMGNIVIREILEPRRRASRLEPYTGGSRR